MKNNFFFTFILVLIFGIWPVFAQDPSPSSTPVKIIAGGVLNGKAITLTKPVFPPAAIAVNAGGAVSVQVTIDENGNIISAEAVSGHPLLRQAAEQAAFKSKFPPTTLQGQTVKVRGIIVYNFVLSLTFNQIGYELALAEKSRSLNRYLASSIADSFPNTWQEEKNIINNLIPQKEDKKADNIAEGKSPSSPGAMRDVESDVSQSDRSVLRVTAAPADQNYVLDENAIESIKQLRSKIENRLKLSNKTLWFFNLGRILHNLNADIDNNLKIHEDMAEFNLLIKSQPLDISGAALIKISGIVEASQQNLSDQTVKEKLISLIKELRDMRGY